MSKLNRRKFIYDAAKGLMVPFATSLNAQIIRRRNLIQPIPAAGGGGGGIALSNSYSVVSSGGGDDPMTVTNVVVPANAVIFCFIGDLGTNIISITSVKFNTTETFTVVSALADRSGGIASRNSAYVLHNPTATTANVVVDFSGATASVVVHVLVYTGVENGGGAAGTYRALTTPTGDAGTGADASVAATSGDWIVSSSVNWDNGNNVTMTADKTLRISNQNVHGTGYDMVTQDTNGTVSGTTNMTFTNDEYCTHIAFALIPDA